MKYLFWPIFALWRLHDHSETIFSISIMSNLSRYNTNSVETSAFFKTEVFLGQIGSSIKFRPKKNKSNDFLVCTLDGRVHCYSAAKKKLIWDEDYGTDSNFLCMDIQRNEYNFAVGEKNGQIQLIDFKNQKPVTVYARGTSYVQGHVNRVTSIKFCDDEPCLFISGGNDKIVYVWDVRAKEVRNELKMT